MVAAALETRGHEVLLLPTQLLSGTYDLGKPAQMDTTDYLLKTLARWEEQSISWDCVMIGGVTGLKQARALSDIADRSHARGAPVLLDPILGDGGRVYAGVTEEQTQAFRLLLQHVDVLTPNLTEACLLADVPCDRIRTDTHAQESLAEQLSSAGKRSMVMTSATLKGGRDGVLGVDARSGERFAFSFLRVPGRHLATGDLFSALLVDGILAGHSLQVAAKSASEEVGLAVQGVGEFRLPG